MKEIYEKQKYLEELRELKRNPSDQAFLALIIGEEKVEELFDQIPRLKREIFEIKDREIRKILLEEWE